jgi:putative flippase GtrA
MVQQIVQRRGLRQFVKFCIVGATSTIIDFGIYILLIEFVHLDRFVGSLALARMLAASISFLFAVTNGFYWNNRWTFRHAETEGHAQRYGKFVFSNVIGLALNTTILGLVAHSVPAQVTNTFASYLNLISFHPKDPAGLIGKICATAVVVFWNFTASKYWTFKTSERA